MMLYYIWNNFFKEDTLTSASVATPAQCKQINNALKHAWKPKDGSCPYCHANEQCIHWDGLGWTKDKTTFSYNLPER